MALSGSTIHEVQTGGSDTNNGGMFDPSQTAGMFTDGAATSANTTSPVFTSASYNFVAGDVGAWLYIASGTNWTAGWYKISSVASNAATLNGTIGQGVLKTTLVPTTGVGCATTASPTGATWTIDYSQQASAQFTYTDLASAGAGLTVSSAAKPFAKQQVGNSIVITGGTNFNTGRYVIASVAAAVATVVGPTNITTGAGASGTGGQGGAWASIGALGAVMLASQPIAIKTGSYIISSATVNIAGGCLSCTGSNHYIFGYGSVRGDNTSPPTITASGISDDFVSNLAINCASLTSSRALSFNRASGFLLNLQNCTNGAIASGSFTSITKCSATGCSTVAAFNVTAASHCEAYNNTVTGFLITNSASKHFRCLAYGNSGASSDGFSVTAGNNAAIINCVSYGNGRDGYRSSSNSTAILDSIAENNAGVGCTGAAQTPATGTILANFGSYNNTGGATTNIWLTITAVIAGSGSFFTNAAGNDFSLNNTAGAGALLRAVGLGFPAGTTTSYPDIGAAHHADPAGGVSRSRVQAGF
jgi:hypothetical protein